MPLRSRTSILTLSLALALASPVGAQSAPSVPSVPGATTSSGSQSLDQGFEDISPLGESLILQPIDMRTDFDFERVYSVGDGSGRYTRRHGALNAVFPQSDYVATRRGTRAVVPAGTIYYIGDPVAVEREQVGAQRFQALGTARRIMAAPIVTSDRPELVTELANGRHRAADRASTLNRTPSAEPETRERGATAPAPARIRRDVLTHEPYRQERLHEMTKRAVRALIAEEAEADETEAVDLEAAVEDLEAALER